MNKEQQIEEIAGTICNTCKERFEISKKCKNVIEPCIAAYAHAEAIYNAGYRKIDENCAVITKAELKLYQRQAVKEFAEKLKEYPLESKNLVWEYGVGWLDCYKTVKKAIDELLKEEYE